MKVLDLFAGIGGFSLGLERTGGFDTAAFCEIDKKAQQVLAKHWPNVPIFDDVTTLTRERLSEQGIHVDVITGGFPCQDISLAGKGAGLAGERSGLWFQFHRLIEEIQPKYAIIENVSALRSRGLDAVLCGLAEIGYDAEWHCIPAAAVGAPHRRDRVWLVAYPQSRSEWDVGQNIRSFGGEVHASGDASGSGGGDDRSQDGAIVADTNQPRLERWLRAILQERAGELPAGASGSRRVGETWRAEPDVGRVAHGVPKRVDRLKQLGNAVVPQIPQLLGEAILAWERQA